MIFSQQKFAAPGSLKAFLADPAKRQEANESLRRFLIHGMYAAQADGSMAPVRPPLYNAAQGFYGQGMTEGYISAAIAPGDVGGVAQGGTANQGTPQIYFVPEPGTDMQWMNLFTRRPSSSDGETYEGAAAIFAFAEIKLGDKPKLATISDVKGFTANVKYGAAVSIYRTWIEDNKVWTINNVLAAGRRAAYRYMAELAYTALFAASFDAVTYDTSLVKTLNKAFAALERKGTLVPGVIPTLVCASEEAGLFVQIKHDRQSLLLTGNQLTHDFNVVSTPHVASATTPRMVVPGEGMYFQDRQALRQDEDRDIMLDASDTTFDFRNNFVILSTKGLSATTGKLEASATFKQGVTVALS